MKKEDDSARDAVDDSECSVEREVLLELREGADDEAGEDEWEDDEKCSLADGGGGSVNLAPSLECGVVV